jgi:hypothetical protein
VGALTTVLHSCGHEASEWPQLYQQDPDFTTTYQLLGTSANVFDYHIHGGLLFHLIHLCVPTSEREKLIWEAHYNRMVGHFSVEKIVAVLHKHFFGQNFDRTSASISDHALPVPLPSHPSRRKAYIPLFLLPRILGNPSQWITCMAFHPPSKAMIVYFWLLIGF